MIAERPILLTTGIGIERPVLFSSEMVRAILDSRKTQTRRIYKRKSRFAVGMKLWVREGVWRVGLERTGKNGQYLWPKFTDEQISDGTAERWFDSCCGYTADISCYDVLYDDPGGMLNKMFMPRWASRITLEVTAHRVERLHQIDKWDAFAEGIAKTEPNPVASFRGLWESINGDRFSWSSNPLVEVVTFRVIK